MNNSWSGFKFPMGAFFCHSSCGKYFAFGKINITTNDIETVKVTSADKECRKIFTIEELCLTLSLKNLENL